MRPPTPPPDLDLGDWYASLDRIAALDASALYLAHYGWVRDVSAHLAQLRRRLGWWGEMMLAGMRQHKSDEELATMLADRSDAEITQGAADDTALLERYEIASNYLMSAQGYRRYYQKTHPELLTARETS